MTSERKLHQQRLCEGEIRTWVDTPNQRDEKEGCSKQLDKAGANTALARIFHKRLRRSSSPMRNRNIAMPSSAMWRNVSAYTGE